ncbi:MAG: type II secretion system protein [Candidatus Omnitrophica bacterium]|nr:type II secretion system protein [Candidatus Omnitrophota bacterium]
MIRIPRNVHKKGFTITELAVVLIVISMFISILYPIVYHVRNKAKIITCRDNLQKISLGIRLYASENQEIFPSSLDELVKEGYVEGDRVFDCPGSPHAGNAKEPDYHYITGYTLLAPSDTAILFDKDENHKSGKHVLYISGDIEWLASKTGSK